MAQSSGDKASRMPIDIHYNKMLEWLADRRIVKKGWQVKLREVRNTIGNASEALPENGDLSSFLKRKFLEYFTCKELFSKLEKLEGPEGSKKTLFGGFHSTVLNDWSAVISAYEKDNLFLAESASLLVKNVNYELKALRKQIAKDQKMMSDIARKKMEYTRLAQEHEEAFLQLCKDWGVSGNDLEEELRAESLNLRSAAQEVANTLSGDSIKNSMSYYHAMRSYLLTSIEDNAVRAAIEAETALPILSYILSSGNTEVWEFVGGEKPAEVGDSGDAESDGGSIDWGDSGDEGQADVDIDWGDSGDAGGEIDWGDDFEVVGAPVEGAADTADVADADHGAPKFEFSDSDLRSTMLEVPQIRGQLLTELIELKSFLEQREKELGVGSASNMAISAYETLPADVLKFNHLTDVKKLLTSISNAINLINDERTNEYLLIRSSDKYCSQVASQIGAKRKSAKQLLSSVTELSAEEAHISERLKEASDAADALRTQTLHIKQNAESALSKLYEDRAVHIIGEITTI